MYRVHSQFTRTYAWTSFSRRAINFASVTRTKLPSLINILFLPVKICATSSKKKVEEIRKLKEVENKMLCLGGCVCACVGAVHLARFGYNPQSECPFVRSSRKSWNCAGTFNCDLVPGKAHFRFIFKHLRLKCLLCQCPERQGAGQAVQNHHKRQEMRKQIAKQEEKNFSPMLASWPARCRRRRRHTSNA